MYFSYPRPRNAPAGSDDGAGFHHDVFNRRTHFIVATERPHPGSTTGPELSLLAYGRHQTVFHPSCATATPSTNKPHFGADVCVHRYKAIFKQVASSGSTATILSAVRLPQKRRHNLRLSHRHQRQQTHIPFYAIVVPVLRNGTFDLR